MSKRQSKTPLIYALEPRLLFDGDLGADVASAIVYRDGNATDAAPAVAPENQKETQRENISFEFHSTRSAIVFIDGGVEDPQTLADAAADVLPDDAQIHILDGDSDGFAQINDILQNHDRVDEIHIFGHGAAGEARLGTASLSLETLTTHSDTLAVLKDTLTEDGDILLYGCNIAAGEDGRTFIEELAELTAADIAASDDLTGAGGDWELEFNSGPIEANTIEAWDYQYALTPDGVASMNSNVVERTHSNLNVKAQPDIIASDQSNNRGFYDYSNSERFVIALEKSNISATETLYFDFGVSVGQGGSYNVSSGQRVASYLVALNNDVGRRDSGNAQIVFENDILGYYVDKYNTLGSGTMREYDASREGSFQGQGDGDTDVTQISNSYFANSSWTYPTTSEINKRDSEGYFQRAFGTGSSGGADYVWTSNNTTLNFAAKNGNASGTGDFIRVITKWQSPPTVTSATDVSGSVTELTDGHANENTATLTDTGYFAIADSNGDTVTVSRAFSSTTHSSNSAFGDLTATIANNTTTDGTGQINWTYSVDDSDLDALDAGESYVETWTITVSDGSASVTQNVTVTINGAADSNNQAPTVSTAAVDPTVNEAVDASSQVLNGGGTIVFGDDTDNSLTITAQTNSTVSASSGVTLSNSLQDALAASITLSDKGDNTADWTLNTDGLNLDFLAVGDSITVENVVTATDDDGATETDTITVIINGTNDAPTAADDSHGFSVTSSPASYNVLNNDSDPDGTTPTVSAIETGGTAGSGTAGTVGTALAGTYGSLTLNSDGAYTYAVDAGNAYVAAASDSDQVSETFTYTITDGSQTDTATITFNVSGVNDAPTAADNTVTINEDATKTFAASEFNFADVDGDSLDHITIATVPATGTLTLSGTAVEAGDDIAANQIENLVYTPVANGNGDPYTSFTFTVNDGTADSASSYTMTVDVTPVNDAPVAVDSEVTTQENTRYYFSSSDFGFSDAEDTLTYGEGRYRHFDVTSLPTSGTLTVQSRDPFNPGSYNSYTSFNGDVFEDIGWADLGEPGDNPNRMLYFTPDADESGNAYTTFQFRVYDSNSASNANGEDGVMTINVTPVNDAPTAADNTVTTNEDEAHTFAASEFNFADVDGDSLDHVTIVAGPAAGALTLNGNAVNDGDDIAAADIGNLVFTPAANANGDPYTSFTFTVNDGTADSASAYTITIDVTPVNDAPTAADNTVTTAETTSHRFAASEFNFADVDGDSLHSISIDSLPTTGTLTYVSNPVALNQTITAANIDDLYFSPRVGESGDPYTSFTFTVNDGTADSASSYTMTVDVTPVNDAPTAANNTVTTNEDTAHTFAASEFNFADVDSDSLDHITIATLPSTGTLTLSGTAVEADDDIAANQIENLVYTPVANGNGDPYTSFTFTVNDGTADSASSYTMTVDVTPVNDAPTAADNTVTTNEDEAHTFAASEFNFADVDGDSLDHVTIVAGPAAGALTLNGNAVNDGDDIAAADIGNLVFTPAANANGDPYTSFTFTVNDGTADSASAYTITIDVTPVNDAPTAADNTVTTAETTSHRFAASEFNFADVDSDSLDHITIATLPATGTLTLSGTAVEADDDIAANQIENLVYTPVANGNGDPYTSFTFTVNDGTADSASSYTMTVDVTPVNDAPTAADNTVTTNEDEAHRFAASEFNFADVDGDSLDHITIATLPATGTLTLSGTAVEADDDIAANQIENLVYTPVANGNGDPYTSFTFTVNDGTADSASSYTMTVDVTPVNDAPTAANNTVTTNEDTAHTFAASDFNFADVDSDSLDHITIATLPATGTLTLSGTAVEADDDIAANQIENLVYTPVANGNGDPYTSFTFTVNDGTADSASSYTMTVDVTPVNDAPTAADNTVTTNEDEAHRFAASEFNFADVDGDSLDHITIATLPATGTLTLSGTAVEADDDIAANQIENLVYTPVANGNGDPYTSFTFTVNDGTADSASSYTMTVDVTPVNDAPTAANNTVTTNEDTAHTFAASDFNFADVDSDSLDHITIATLPATGTLTLSGTAVEADDDIAANQIENLVYTPVANGNGDPYTSFTFTVNDGTADSASSYTMTVDVTPANDAPVVSAITDSTTEDAASFDTDLLSAQTDPDGDTLSVSGSSITAVDGNNESYNLPDGTASVTNGTLTVDPTKLNGLDDGESVDITVTYDVSDGTTTTQNTATITVTGVNDAPVVSAITDSTTEDAASFDTDLLSAQTDPDGDTLSVSGSSITAVDGNNESYNLPDGTASVTNGTLTVDPTKLNGLGAGESVDITVTYDVSDGTTTTQNTATITVTGVNDAPVVSAITDSTTEDAASFDTDLLSAQTDPDGDTLSVSGSSITAVDGNNESYNLPDGAASVTNGTLTVDPTKLNGLGAGESVDITVTYDVSDGTTTTQNTATITVTGVNDAPTANNDSANVIVGFASTGNAINNSMGGEDTDPDESDTLSITAFADADGVSGTVDSQNGLSGQYGRLVLNSDGSLTYNADLQPALDLTFEDAAVTDSFTYTVSDGNGGTETATLVFSIKAPEPGDAPPSVSPINISTTENDAAFSTDLLAGQSDPNGDNLSIYGRSIITAIDNDGNEYPWPDAAIAVSDNILSINPSTVDELDNGESIDLIVTYNVSDGELSAQNTATITVTGVNDAPVVSAITDSTTEDAASFDTDLLSAQTDPDGDTLSVSGSSITAVDGNNESYNLPDGTASVTNGTLTVDPTKLNGLDDGESVDITVTYDVSDGTTTTQNTATITVTGVNDAPVVSAITDSTTEDAASFDTDLLSAQTDPDGDTLSVSGSSITAVDGNNESYNLPDGTASVTNGTLTVDPTKLNGLGAGESVDITVTYDVSDGTTTTQNTATITVTGVNDAPTASNNEITITEDPTHTFSADEFNFIDIDGDVLNSIEVKSLPTKGTLTLSGSAVTQNQQIIASQISNLVYTPIANDAGIDYSSFTFTVNDGEIDSASTYSMNIDVTGQNDPPEVAPIIDARTEDDAAFTKDLTLGQTDPDNDDLTVTGAQTISAVFANGDGVSLPTGTVTIEGNSLTINPNLLNALPQGESVVITINYDISDGELTSTNTATITVSGRNDAPTSSGKNIELNGEEPISLTREDFAFNDIDGDDLDNVKIETTPTKGKLYLNGIEVKGGDGIPAQNIKDLVYEPGIGASGSNYDAFTFSVNDGQDQSLIQTMTVGVNAAPAASDVTVSLSEDKSFSGQMKATDMENAQLTYRITQEPEHGTVTVVGNGPDYIYLPDPHYYGPDKFIFEVSDGTLTDTGEVDIDVTPENDHPVQRYVIQDVSLMEGQKAKIFIAQAFAEVDALNPSLSGFNNAIEKLFEVGQFKETDQLINPPASGQLTYSATGLPEGLELNSKNRIGGKSSELGTFPIVVRATDGEGQYLEISFKLTVSKPVIDSLPERKVASPLDPQLDIIQEKTPELSDHDMPPVLKVKPQRDGVTPERSTDMNLTSPLTSPDNNGSSDENSLMQGDWLNTRVSSQQDLSGNIRVVGMDVKDTEISVQIADQAVDAAERFKGEMSDGTRLPDWITVDAATGLTKAEPPQGAGPIEMRVVAEDNAGNERSIDIILDTSVLEKNDEKVEKTPREIRREVRQAAREARQEERQRTRETRQNDRIAARNAKELTGSTTNVEALIDGRVMFTNEQSALGNGGMRLLSMASEETLLKIQIDDVQRVDETRYEVRMTNGSTTPDWLSVNPLTGELTIDAPEDIDTLELQLIAVQGNLQRSIQLQLTPKELLQSGTDDAEKTSNAIPEEMQVQDEVENVEQPTEILPDISRGTGTGHFVPLDAQIEDALAESQYGRDIQYAFQDYT